MGGVGDDPEAGVRADLPRQEASHQGNVSIQSSETRHGRAEYRSIARSTGRRSDRPISSKNVLHDGSAEVLEAFDRFGERGGLHSVTGHEPSAASTGTVTGKRKRVAFASHGDTGTAARFFYCAKASPSDRNDAGPNLHPTVKPTALMEYLVRLVTPPGGVVLDPFAGSGTTGKAACQLGAQFIGIEKDASYADLARRRIGIST